MISIVVPAHNEAAIITRSVTALLTQQTEVPYQVIVVANGCDDDTAQQVRALQPMAGDGVELTLIDTPHGGKVNALNLGDRQARFPHRIYCDGDLVVTGNLVAQTASAFATEDPVFVSYRLRAIPGRSRITRAYARMWSRLPLLTTMPHGIGLYGVNQAGRARWDEYPQIVADDRFARLQFRPSERRRLDAVEYEFAMPEGVSELLAVRTRWARGNEELARKYPELLQNEDQGNRYRGFLRQALRHPIDFAAFVGVFLYGKIQGRRKAAQGNVTWERAARSRDA